MKIKCCLPALVVFFIVSSVSAQKLHGIKGLVVDSISHKPTEYVTVILKTAKGFSVKSTLTKEDGSFMFEKLTTGRYRITITAVAYQSKSIAVNIDSGVQVNDIRKIEITGSNKRLKEIQITSNRPLVKQEIDRLVYDVHADPENKGLNVLEVMQKVPLLSLDAEDNLQLKGSSDFKIYVNGKPSGVMSNNPAEALRVMRALSIKKIEVITTPSAKYDSEGAAGIINIVTNSSIEGYNIIFEMFRTSWRGVFGIGSAFTAKRGKFGISGYAGRYSRTDVPISTFSNSRISFIPYQSIINNGYTTTPKGNLIPANADLSYEIDSLNLLTSSIVISLNNFDQNSMQSFDIFDQQGNLNSSYTSATASNPKVGLVDVSLNYQLGFKNKKGRLLTTSYRYANTINDFNSYNTTTGNFNYVDNQLAQLNNAGLREQTMQLDYVNPGKIINLEGGAKLILRDNYSNFNTESFVNNGSSVSSNNFTYDQNIYSLYNDYQFKLKNWGLYAGLRMERTVIDADFIKLSAELNRSYTNLIPSVIIQHKLESSGSLNLGYTQRIQRPGIIQLNPFENQSNSLFYTSGNPNLVPVINNSFDLNYSTIMKGAVNIGLNYAFANNTIQNIVTIGNDGISRSTFANIGKNDNLGANLSVNYPVAKNLKANFNWRAQYLWLTGIIGEKGYNNEGFSFTSSNDFSYTIPKDWRLRFLITTATPVVGLQGQINGYVASVFSLNKEFLNKKLGVIFRIDNPTQKYRTTINRLTTQDFIQQNLAMKTVRGYYINVYYTIGELKEKIKKNKRSIDNNDVNKTTTEPN